MSSRITLTPAVVKALGVIRSNLHGMSGTVHSAFSTLEESGVFEAIDLWERTNGWPALPFGVSGQQIRHRKICTGGVRLGGAEPKAIVVETGHWVIYATYAPSGRHLGERVATLADFENEFERKE